MYSLLWSEHCAYKHSKKLLRTLPDRGRARRDGPGRERRRGRRRRRPGVRLQGRVAQPPERGRALPGRRDRRRRDPARHLRDRRAADRGARLAALRRARRAQRSRYLLDGAVAGIGHYGNSIGVPTVGGEVYFEAPYEQNCLVNAMALGLGRARAARCAAPPPAPATCSSCSAPRPAATGSAARRCWPRPSSATATTAKRPTVQVGDPFAEKKLLECSLELLERGPARLAPGPRRRRADLLGRRRWPPRARSGSTSTSTRVPLREPGMEPFEVMVSESQERMLCVVEPANVDAVLAVCEKWEVGGAGDRRRSPTRGAMRVLDGGELVGDMPVRALVDDCPLYDLAARASPTEPLYPPPPRDARRRGHAARDAARAAALSPTSPRAGRCSSSTTRSCSRAPCAAPSRPTPRCWRSPRRRRAGRVSDRRQRPPRRRRPLPRHGRGGARVRREPRLRRRRAARHDQQPQLRQPREAAHRLAADRVGARPRRRLPRARGADRRRQRLALQRGRRPARSTRRR